jgi:hypothetical protein
MLDGDLGGNTVRSSVSLPQDVLRACVSSITGVVVARAWRACRKGDVEELVIAISA